MLLILLIQIITNKKLNHPDTNIIQDSDSEDEYTNSIELITEEDIENMNNSDSD